MSEPSKRRNLLQGNLLQGNVLQALGSGAPRPLPDEAIAEVAARNGFPNVAPALPPVAAGNRNVLRRQRQPTGRDHQFNVRLQRVTLDFIYSQANERNVAVARVIEDMADALRREQQR